MSENPKPEDKGGSQPLGTDRNPPAPPTPDPPTDAPPPDPKTEPEPPGEPNPVALGLGGNAPLGPRIGGALIDALVAFALSFLVSAILPFDGAGMLSWAVAAAYWVVRDSLSFLEGQSLGKKVAKLKVVKEDGSDLVNDWQNALLRNVLLIIPFGALVELIVLLIRQDKPEAGKRFGDDWAKTKVLVAK